MINIYLCEDELAQLTYYKNVITAFIRENNIDAEIISAQRDPLLTLKDVKNNDSNPALFFLDIELKDYSMDGFELAKKIKKNDIENYIVFLTSQEDLAFKAFEYKLEPLDYIIKKPEYFLSTRMSKEVKERMTTIFQKVELLRKKKKNNISISTGSRVMEVNKEDILFVQAVKGSHQIEIYLPYKKLTIRQSLKNMSELLDDSFVYISKSCIVQREKIKEIDKKERIVSLDGGYELEVSYREIKNLCDLFQDGYSYGMVVQ